MIDIASYDTSDTYRRYGTSSGGGPSCITDFIGNGRAYAAPYEDGLTPQAFLVELSPGGISRPHFHPEDQFQVVALGGGTLGKHAVAPVSVHYTNRHTGYGPITAGDQGIGFFTLRQIANRKAFYLPEARDEIDPKAPKRQMTVHATPVTPADLAKATTTHIEELIAPQEDGLAAWMANVPPRGEVAFARHPRAGGRFYIVIAGNLSFRDGAWDRFAILFASPDEATLPMTAGDEGLQLLAMQYPDRAR